MFFLRKEYFDLVVPPKHTGLLKPLNIYIYIYIYYLLRTFLSTKSYSVWISPAKSLREAQLGGPRGPSATWQSPPAKGVVLEAFQVTASHTWRSRGRKKGSARQTRMYTHTQRVACKPCRLVKTSLESWHGSTTPSVFCDAQ